MTEQFDLSAYRYQHCDVCAAETMHCSTAEGRPFVCVQGHPYCWGCRKHVASAVRVGPRQAGYCAKCAPTRTQ